MRDPFRIDGPTAITVSGGRTSGLMLRMTLDRNNGMPADATAMFCNTGKEDEATLVFVRDMSEKWGVQITWLEYRRDGDEGGTFEVVTFESASRAGEPFEAVIAQRGGKLPNPVARYCSSEMKTRTMHRYLRSLGIQEWDTFLGIRADEPARVSKFRANPHPETKDETVSMPLADLDITAHVVGEFWRNNDFDLGLPNMNGKTMHGNCDLCMMKPASQVFSLIHEKPERAVWWARQEEKAAITADGNGRFFRIDRPSYRQMRDYSASQINMFDRDERAIPCLCGD